MITAAVMIVIMKKYTGKKKRQCYVKTKTKKWEQKQYFEPYAHISECFSVPLMLE